jgi:uncharacterized membrane protein
MAPIVHLAQEHSVVAIYESHADAEAAVKALQQGGLDMTRLSIVGRGFHTEEHAVGFYTSGDRMKYWGGNGAVWGGLWGMLFGGAFFFIPAIGPLMVMGPLVGWIAAALEGAALGGAAGVLAAAFSSVGIPEDSVVKYELEVKAGNFLVLARGTPDRQAHRHRLRRGFHREKHANRVALSRGHYAQRRHTRLPPKTLQAEVGRHLPATASSTAHSPPSPSPSPKPTTPTLVFPESALRYFVWWS